MIDKRIQYRVGGASGREYDQGGNRNTRSTKSNPNMGGGGGRDLGRGPIGPVAPPTTFIGGKRFNVTPFNRDERERAQLKSMLERTKPGNYNLVDPVTGQSKRSFSAGLGSFLGTLLGFLTGNPFVSLAMGGFDRLKNFNQRLQDSDFGRSTSLMDFLDMRKYGGYDKREEARKNTMDEARLLTESLGLSTNPRERAIMGLPIVDKFTGAVKEIDLGNPLGDDRIVPEEQGLEGDGTFTTSSLPGNNYFATKQDENEELLRKLLNTEDTNLDKFIEDKNLKEDRQQELLNEILTG
mgnify:CR=1 FL=1